MKGAASPLRKALMTAPGTVRTRLAAASAHSPSADSSALVATHRDNPSSDRIIAAFFGSGRAGSAIGSSLRMDALLDIGHTIRGLGRRRGYTPGRPVAVTWGRSTIARQTTNSVRSRRRNAIRALT